MSVQFEIRIISDKAGDSVKGFSSEVGNAATKVTGLNSKLKSIGDTAFAVNNIRSAISGITGALNSAIEPGVQFNTSLTDLSSITGVTGDALKAIGDDARQTAMDFGIDAAAGVESYKLLLSQLGPDLAKTPELMRQMGRDAAILSKQLGGDVAGATGILTTALNQYGVSIDDPIAATKAMGEMMNIMSAGAKEGSAELPAIKSALEQAGMMAKTANVPFNELNAAIQVLDQSGKKGAEGGVALRNVMARLSEGEFLPKATLQMLNAAGIDVQKMADKSLSLSQRLELLKPLMNDTAAMTQLFGTENVAAGIALVTNAERVEELTGKITGTNTATEMADIVMTGYSEKLARTNAWLKDLGISIFNATDGFIPFVNMGMSGLEMVSHLGGAIETVSILSKTKFVSALLGNSAATATQAAVTGTATTAQWSLNAALTANPIGIVVVAIAALVGGLVLAYNKSENFRGAIHGLIEVGKLLSDVFLGVGKTIVGALTFDLDMIKEGAIQAENALGDIFSGGIGRAFDRGFQSQLKENQEQAAAGAAEASAKTISENIQIPGITVQGAAVNDSPLAGYKPGGSKGGSKNNKTIKDTASNISSGGARATHVTLTIQKLENKFTITANNVKESARQVSDEIVEAVLMALQSANSALSTN